MAAVVVAAGLVAYNNLLNRWPPFNRWLYVPLNVTTAGVLVGWGTTLGLSSGALGLQLHATDLLLGALAALALTAPLFLASAHPRTAALVADERVRGLTGRQLAYQVLVRIPLGTALLEEVAFRGVLFALFRHAGIPGAALWSGICFGLWHIAPTMNMVAANRPRASGLSTAAAVVATVVATAAVGLFLVWLRLRTGSISAGFALHAGVNALATLAASAAHRVREHPEHDAGA